MNIGDVVTEEPGPEVTVLLDTGSKRESYPYLVRKDGAWAWARLPERPHHTLWPQEWEEVYSIRSGALAVYALEYPSSHVTGDRTPFEHVGGDGFVTKDSGERQEFGNGSVRDTEEGKPRYDLVSPIGYKRQAELMARGAVKYGERNWELGQPASRFLSSLMRHVENYRLGDRAEDHLAAVAYNVYALMHFEGTEWDDLNE